MQLCETHKMKQICSMLGHACSRLGSLQDQSPTISTVLRVIAAETMAPIKYEALNIEVTGDRQKWRLLRLDSISYRSGGPWGVLIHQPSWSR